MHGIRSAARLFPALILPAMVVMTSGCAEKFDNTRKPNPRGTMGEELYRVLCERIAADENPTDVSGAASKDLCRGNAEADDTTTPRLAALAKNRERLVAALDRAIPKKQEDDLSVFLLDLLPYYSPPTDSLPAQSRAIANVVAGLVKDPAAIAALESFGARDGYRQFRVALGLARPMLAYPRFDEFVGKALSVIDKKGSAGKEWTALSEALAMEMGAADGDTTSPPPGTETTLSVGRGLLYTEGDAFGTGTPRWFSLRDGRGVVAVNRVQGALVPPFVDMDQDGLADVDDTNHFVGADGKALAVPPPFVTADNATGTRDDAGRALATADGAPTGNTLYQYADADRTLLAGMSREMLPWLNPLDPVALDVASGIPVLMGGKMKRKEVFGAAVLQYDGYNTADAPLFDLVYAIGTLFDKQETDDLLAVMEILLRDHEDVVAALIDSGLFIDAAAEQSDASLRHPSDFWDDVIKVGTWIAQEPGLMEGLLRSFADPRASRLGQVYAQMMRNRDRITYDRNDVNAPLDNVTFAEPVNRNARNTDFNQSIFQRSLSVIHDLNYAKLCNKEGAELGVNIKILNTDVFAKIPGTYHECELMESDNQAKLYAQSIIGRAKIEIKPPTLQGLLQIANLLNITYLNADTLLERESGIDGMTTTPTPQALARLVFSPHNEFVNSLVGAAQTRDGADVSIRHRDSIFAWERKYTFNDGRMPNKASFFDTMTPMLTAFDDYDSKVMAEGIGPDGVHERYLFGELISALHTHWPARGTDTTQELDPTKPFYAHADGGSNYEELTATLFDEGKLTLRLYDLLTALSDIEIRPGVDGITVLSRATEQLLDPTRNDGLVDRRGKATTRDNSGEETLPETPIYLILDALNRFDDAFKNEPTRHERWLHARGRMVDQLFTVDTTGAAPALSNRRSLTALRILVPFIRQRIAAHRDAGDLTAWSKGLAPRFEASMGSALGTSILNFVDAVQNDPEAKDELQALMTYLLSEGSTNDAFDASLVSVADQLQIFQDSKTLAPLLRELSVALAPNAKDVAQKGGTVDTKDSALEAVLALLRDIHKTEHRLALQALLANLVSLDDGAKETPLETILDVIGEVNRAAPGAGGRYNAADYQSILDRSHSFLQSDEHGLERLYAVTQQRKRN